MAALRRAVGRHPLTWFVITAYAFSWWSVPFANGAMLPYGPFIAAVLVVSITKGRAGLSELFRRVTSWREGWRWLLIAPCLVMLYLVLALAVNLLLGATISNTSHLSFFGPTLLTLVFLGGQWEEPGWTGFALPLLQDRNAGRPRGLLEASLIMGLTRGGWHLPLVLSGTIPWFDAVFYSMALQFLISWLHNRTGGSVLVPMLSHFTSNVVAGGIMFSLFSGSDRDRYFVLFIAIAWLLAVALNRPRQWSMGRLETDAAEI